MKRDLAATLDAERSGITADELTVGAGRKVWWRCPDFPQEHDGWEAVVGNRTGGFRKRFGTGCPDCRLVKTSAQELRLKAELSTVLPIDPDRGAIRTTRVEHVDMVVEAEGLRLVLEFDGSYFHGAADSLRKDSAKSQRLRAAGWTVVRIREAPLGLLDAAHDVVVGFVAEPEDAAADVLDHLAGLGLVDTAAAERYRALGAPQGAETARTWIRERIGEQALKIEYTAHNDAWDSMFEALVSYSAETGHCYPTDDVAVDGRSLGRWSRKQRGRQRQGRLRPDRAERLATIPAWSSGTVHEAGFWSRYGAYLQRAEAAEADEREKAMPSREATVWANNLRGRREDLLAQGRDLPDDQLKAMEEIPGWSWNPFHDGHTAKIRVMQQFITATGRTVASVKQREEWSGHPIGIWVNSWRTRRDTLSDSQETDLETLAGWTWNPRDDQWEEMFLQLTGFGTDHGHIRPSLTLGSEQEKALARWKRNQKNRLQGRADARARALRTLLARYGEQLP
ncbi:Helicase associated domain protein [Streptomyces sp. WAC00263]|uniref:Helicase associated domain protein n=1 Tax=Streptomyces sp. WAC00263 TaxID=1917422 RepID=UPI0024103182|nr:Helicase associated domain protein [Streptomyces sp. WAC00263]